MRQQANHTTEKGYAMIGIIVKCCTVVVCWPRAGGTCKGCDKHISYGAAMVL